MNSLHCSFFISNDGTKIFQTGILLFTLLIRRTWGGGGGVYGIAVLGFFSCGISVILILTCGYFIILADGIRGNMIVHGAAVLLFSIQYAIAKQSET